ncbi:MAG: alkaline phosphatase family protein [Zhenhengia sp.]|uniref:alkaline phosphatase family protein n=1 Tax=Zhenhengia sp. TaxID=2944208 RepID=UPI003992E813
MSTPHLLVVSLDAVSSKDLTLLKTLPNFSKFLSQGALIERVHSISPTLTYPAHTTIVTGNYPIHHGIINNTLLEPSHSNPNWYWYAKAIKTPTLFDLAHKKGLTTCSILWPVTGCSQITYNLPEIFPTKKWHHQLIMSGLAGSLNYQLEILKKFGHLRQGTKQPYLDDFVMSATKYTLLKYKPDLICVHLTDVDTHRHYTGYSSESSIQALYRHDKRLGEIIETLKEAHLYDSTHLVLLGDHDQLPVHSFIRLNQYLLEKGFIRCNKKGRILSYDAIAKSCDGSSYIYLKDKHNLELMKQIQSLLNDLQSLPPYPIEKCLSGKEASSMGADDLCAFMLEAKEGYYFIDDLSGELIEPVHSENVGIMPHHVHSAHGYLTSKADYTTFFMASGPLIKPNFILPEGELVNHAPLLAYLLGLEFKNIDGHMEWKLLNEVNA